MANVIIPSSSEDRKKVQKALDEFSASLTRVEAERDHQKEILAMLQDEFELPKKYMRKVARVYHKQNLHEFTAEATEVEDIYESIVS